MAIEKHKTDYQLVAEAHGVTVGAVYQAVKRRVAYPNNALLKALNNLQKNKSKLVQPATMKAIKNNK